MSAQRDEDEPLTQAELHRQDTPPALMPRDPQAVRDVMVEVEAWWNSLVPAQRMSVFLRGIGAQPAIDHPSWTRLRGGQL